MLFHPQNHITMFDPKKVVPAATTASSTLNKDKPLQPRASGTVVKKVRPKPFGLNILNTPINAYKGNFTIVRANVLFQKKLTLEHGEVIDVTVMRGGTESESIKPKDKAKDTSSGDWNCSTVTYTGEVHSKDPVILNEQFVKMYPGAIYNYEDIANGNYTPQFPKARKPMTIFTSDLHSKTTKLIVEKPNSADVANAVSKIINSAMKAVRSRTYGTQMTVRSAEELFIQTGGSGHYLGVGGETNIDYSSQNQSNKYYMEIFQSYYTVSVSDSMIEPTDFFFTKEEQPNKPDAISNASIDPNWVYVDSVTYGRMLQIMFESNESLESAGIDIEAKVNFGITGGSAFFSMAQEKTLSTTNVEVVAVGGNPIMSGKLLNAENLTDLRHRIDDFFSGTNDEMPIAFSLRTLDHETISTKMMTEFTSRQCAPKANKYKVTWDKVHCNDQGSGGKDEIGAFVRITAHDGKGQSILDIDKFNTAVNMMEKSGLSLLWTFSKGDKKDPLLLATGNDYLPPNKAIVFPIVPTEKDAKIKIEIFAEEYDTFGTAAFNKETWESRITEDAACSACDIKNKSQKLSPDV